MLKLSTKSLAATAFAIALLAAWYASRIDVAQFVTDDGGICLRYADRLAHGEGFDYNDGQRVNGASCALYTWLLAGMMAVGFSPAGAVSAIAIPAFAATAGLLFWTFARYWSVFAALFCLCAFGSVEFLFDYLFDALEPTLVMLLAAALFHALHTQSRTYQGIVIGLLVADKLDGAFAALAFTLVWFATRRTFPLRIALVALATAAPVFLLLLWRFGSVFPQSAATKMFADLEDRAPFDPRWVCRTLIQLLPLLCVPAAMSFAIPRGLKNGFALRTIQAWFVAHVLAYSLIDLSAPFPWYCSLPAFLVVLLATIFVDTLVGKISACEPEVPAGVRSRRIALRTVAFLLLAGFAWIHCWPAIRGRMPTAGRDRLMPNSASEIGRLAIGAWLRKHTSGTELLSTGYGLPAFEYRGPVYDITALNSRIDPRVAEQARYSTAGPFTQGRTPNLFDESGLRLVATFQYGAEAEMHALYASPESEIARAGLCHMRFALLAAAPLDLSTRAPASHERYRFDHGDLFARVPADFAYTVRSPCPPSFAVTPELRSLAGHASQVDLRISINGVEVDARTMTTGERGARRVFSAQAPALGATGDEYTIVLSVRGAGVDTGDSWLMWGNPTAWVGEALSPSDFRLMCAPWARRIERAEQVARE